MNVTHNDCLEITAKEYLDLQNPEFIGQSGVCNNIYYYYWLCDGQYYRTKQQLVPDYMLEAIERRRKQHEVKTFAASQVKVITDDEDDTLG